MKCRRKNVNEKLSGVILGMNSITQKQSSKILFNCLFCGYQSRLELEECPDCGRIKRDSKPGLKHSGARRELQYQSAANSKLNAPMTGEPPATKSCVYECEHCQYQSRNYLHECPECGRLKFAKITALAASGFSVDNGSNQNFYKRRKTRQLANRVIFENSHVFYAIILCALTFPAYLFRSELSAMLIYLLSMAIISLYLLLNYCISVTVSIDGIAQKNLFGGWEVSWSEIAGWNEFAVGDGKSSICFRTGANVYKINADILNPGRVKKIKEYFEEYCGEPLQGSDRIGGWWW
jgi:hypothetical protein